MNPLVLTTEYFGPVSSYAYILGSSPIWIEKSENYQKKSFRNRCHITSPQGVQILSVPLKKGKNMAMPITQVEISYEEDWISDHIRAMEMGYNNSPFFEFYIDEIKELLNRKKSHLIELNQDILDYFCEVLDVSSPILETSDYIRDYPIETMDFRKYPSPSKRQGLIQGKSYVQPFDDHYGYVNDLSILDLIFCMGPESVLYLENEMI